MFNDSEETKYFLVEHTDGSLTFWIDNKEILKDLHKVKKVFKVRWDFTVENIVDYVVNRNTEKMEEVKL